MLRLDGLRIRQDGFALAADWSVAPGARVAVMGASGAGKSTLLGAIAGFVPVVGGRVTWQGRDIGALPPGARPLSILFQDNNLFPHLDAASNVALALRPDLRLRGDEAARVAAALDRVGLAGMGGRRPAALSGGEQGRVALARVLLRARPMLLLDEPFAALGPALRADMLDLVADIAGQAGTLVLMVTHDPGDARRFAHEIVHVHDGTAEAPLPARALLDAPPPALRAYLGG